MKKASAAILVLFLSCAVLGCGGGGGGGGTSGGGTTASSPEITTSSLPSGDDGEYYVALLESTGGEGVCTWSIIQGSCPTGITLDADTGTLEGTPTELGIFNITVEVEDSNQNTDTQALSITISNTLDDSFVTLGAPGDYTGTNNVTTKANVVDLPPAEDLYEDPVSGTITITDPSRVYSVDEILVGDENNPFLKKITSVTINGNTVVLETENANLSDMIESGSFSFKVTPQWDSTLEKPRMKSLMKAYGIVDIDNEGAIRFSNASLFSLTIKSNGTIDWANSTIMNSSTSKLSSFIKSLDVSGCSGGTISATITEGMVKLVPTIEADYDFDWLGLESASATMDAIFVYSFTIQVSASGAASLKIARNIFPEISVPVVVGGIPMEIILELPAGFELETSVQGTATLQYQSQYAIHVEQEYTRSGGYSVSKQIDKVVDEKDVDWNVTGHVKAELYLEPTVKVRILRIVGPYIFLHPYIRGELYYPWEVARDELFLGIGGGVGLELTEPLFETTLLNLKSDNLFDLYLSWDLIGPSEGAPANTAPVASNISINTSTDGELITLQGSDYDGNILTYCIVDSPGHGTLGLLNRSSGEVYYHPEAGFTGSDSFTFKVNDGKENSNPATVDITIANVSNPDAEFTVSLDNYTVYVDASFSKSYAGYFPELQKRWDWENDDTFDTPWSTDYTNDYTYSQYGTYVIKLQVKDVDGKTDTTTQVVDVSGELNEQPSIINTVSSLGTYPLSLAIEPDGGYIYVVNDNDGTVSIIQTSDNTVIKTVKVGDLPSSIAAEPNGNYVYVTNRESDTVSVIRVSNNTVVKTITVGDRPTGICADPGGDYVYVSNRYDKTVSVIRVSDNTVDLTIDLAGREPHGIVAEASGNYVYVANPLYNKVSVIDRSINSVITTINVGELPANIALSPNNTHIYVTNYVGSSVTVIRLSDNTIIDTIDVGTNPECLTVASTGKFVFVSNKSDDTVSIIKMSDNTVIGTINVGDAPIGLTSDPEGGMLYVANYNDSTVSIIPIINIPTYNDPPQVMLTSGITKTTPDNTPTFTYIGSDNDGSIIGYYVSINDATPGNWTTTTSYTASTLADGEYTFYVQAEDDEGSLSSVASRNFKVDTSGDGVICFLKVASYNAPGTYPTGLAWDGTYLWCADLNTDRIYKLNSSDCSVVESFASPGPQPTGLTWDGAYLWCADSYPNEGKLYKLDPSDCSVVEYYDRYLPQGLAWDGTYLWYAVAHPDLSKESVSKFDSSDGSTVESFVSPGPVSRDLAWDGTYLWCVDNWFGRIYKLNPSDCSVIDYYKLPGVDPKGLAWDGTYLWLTNSRGKIYKLDPSILIVGENPTVVITGGPSGTTSDNTPTFTFSGSDADGSITGYYVAIGDTTPTNWTTSTSYTTSPLSNRSYTFYVQAEDDDGLVSPGGHPVVASRSFTVNASTPPPYTVNINSPNDGFSTSSRLITVNGTISNYSGSTAILSINGRSQTISVSSGSFSETAILTSGSNTITVSANGASDSITGTCTALATKLWVQLTWEENYADVDLYITEPDNSTAYYSHEQNPSGGFLDHDDTDGYGPEHYYISSEEGHTVNPGSYTVRVHYFSSHSHSGSINYKILILKDEASYGTYTGSISTANSSSSSPGDWDTDQTSWDYVTSVSLP